MKITVSEQIDDDDDIIFMKPTIKIKRLSETEIAKYTKSSIESQKLNTKCYTEDGKLVERPNFDREKNKLNVSKQTDDDDIIFMKPTIKITRLSKKQIAKYTKTPIDSQKLNTKCSTNSTLSTENIAIKGRITRSKQMTLDNFFKDKVKCVDGETSQSKTTDLVTQTTKRKIEGSDDISPQTKRKKKSMGTIFETIELENESPVNEIMTVAVEPFSINEVVWGKIRGSPHWPAKIIQYHPRRIEVEWFNDYRTTKLFRSQVFKFYPNFNIFAEKFDSTVGLKVAAQEALMHVASKLNINLNNK